MPTDGAIDIEYGLDERPPPLKAALLGIQVVLLFSGVATLVQTYGTGPVGSKLPIVMGTSFTFVGAATAIGGESGLATVFGAVLVAGFLVEGLIGWQFDRIKPFFPPLVTGLVVVIIGLYLIPVGMDYAAGGVGAADYGALHNVGLAALVLAVSVGLNLYGTGVTRVLSTLVGIAVGYVVAIAGGILMLLGVSPKVGATVTTIPSPVFGGAVLLMAGMVAASGIRLVEQNARFNRRNMVVIAVSIGLGLGIATRPEAASGLPPALETFVSQPVILTALSALVLNAIAPGEASPLFDTDEPPVGPEPTGTLEDD